MFSFSGGPQLHLPGDGAQRRLEPVHLRAGLLSELRDHGGHGERGRRLGRLERGCDGDQADGGAALLAAALRPSAGHRGLRGEFFCVTKIQGVSSALRPGLG